MDGCLIGWRGHLQRTSTVRFPEMSVAGSQGGKAPFHLVVEVTRRRLCLGQETGPSERTRSGTHLAPSEDVAPCLIGKWRY